MYAEVILPVPLSDTYTYLVPPEMEIQLLSIQSDAIGVLVRVEFGKNKHYVGVISHLRDSPPDNLPSIKPLLAIESEQPLFGMQQIRFWEWIAHYYLCRWGEVFHAVISATRLTSLIDKGIMENKKPKKKRLPAVEKNVQLLHPLNIFQQQACQAIRQQLQTKEVCLLHGVTASGKTELYMHLIEEILQQGKQVLYLLPEIALTTHITERLRRFFGDRLGIYHSKITASERVKIWQDLLRGEGYQVILGVRSSIFLPFKSLGLVIVDEEHEPSYKQQDPAPRYHARNAAIVLAKMYGAKVVLGSATPSIESFYNAQSGKYGYVSLNQRFEASELPTLIPVNTKELKRKKQMKTIFSPVLLEKMQETLDKGEQVLLFQNRRGFAPARVCKLCDWTPQCRYCDISLTYHKNAHLHGKSLLSCHYCGRTYQLPQACPECGNNDWKTLGFGTEKVEEEITALFPGAAVERMDADSTKSKTALEGILSRFGKGETQILIGTQMISKGLDFDKVSLVGILNADALMNFPDFRAYERAYQLMSQVSGRAGRRGKHSEVVIQTSHPEHPLIQTVLQQDYEGMYALQSEERQAFHYPPFYRLIALNLKHKKENIVREAADAWAVLLTQRLGDRVIGPDKPAIGHIQNLHIRKILLKIETQASFSQVREYLEDTKSRIVSDPAFRNLIVQYDVDPV
jgi:primosomal protein N' (replication factor Y)